MHAVTNDSEGLFLVGPNVNRRCLTEIHLKDAQRSIENI